MDDFLPDMADTVAEIDQQYRNFYGQTNFRVV